uniref:Aftiphilin clathrin-binding box domain-containing protein n=1 Tax=Ursus maritimus TaxID=29073 RepID=A0A452VKV7_URSMA
MCAWREPGERSVDQGFHHLWGGWSQGHSSRWFSRAWRCARMGKEGSARAGRELAGGPGCRSSALARERVATGRARCPGLRPGLAWGEFEGFQESSSKSEQFFPNFERPERPPHPRRQTVASTQKERGSRQPPQGGPGVPEASGSSPYELLRSYEDVFRFVFQEVPAEQATEGVSPLDSILEPPGCDSGPPPCSESRRLWRALQNTNSTSASRCLWSESRCQENLFLVLGIDAAWKSLSGDPGHTLECSDLKEPEELGVPTFRLQPCRALIQTKLSGTSGGRQGSLLACSLFLKTPLCRNGQHITVPWKKKIFSPRNLKMTLFNSDIC